MNNNIISVSELTDKIARLLEDKIGFVSVRGEISNYKAHTSGHRYFTLKDENAQISCTMWRHKSLSFQPSDGMKVIVTGFLTVYPPRGNYQIECETIAPLGLGDLYMAYEALKKKLEEAGYFDNARKRKIPALPLHIGVSTSPTGAAVRDIYSTIGRRLPACTVYFRHTLVQGEGSAEDIVSAIEELQQTPAEVLIVGRGGGSIEDLWSYNTEIVANAIFNSKVPIISAVGHETDFTIADFVADIRAATPTAAAEIVTPLTIDSIQDWLSDFTRDSYKAMQQKIQSINELLDTRLQSYAFRKFSDRIKTLMQYVDDLESDTGKAINNRIKYEQQRIQSLNSQCLSLNPVSPLNKGFALLKTGNRYVRNDETLGNFIDVNVIRKNEIANVQVLSVNKWKK